MNVRTLHTDADYKAALQEISTLVDADPEAGTPEGDRLEKLTNLIQAYEALHHRINSPRP